MRRCHYALLSCWGRVRATVHVVKIVRKKNKKIKNPRRMGRCHALLSWWGRVRAAGKKYKNRRCKQNNNKKKFWFSEEISDHCSCHVSIRQHTSACVSIRQHTSAYVRHVLFFFLCLYIYICTYSYIDIAGD
jgi:hypothetical protein